MIDRKELVKQAIEFRCPQRIPLVFRGNPDKSDVVGVGCNPAKGWIPSREGEDEWGCIWDNLIGTGAGQVKWHPITRWDDFENYCFPNPHAEGRFDKIGEMVKKYEDRYILAGLGIGIGGFHRMTFLRGFENVLSDIYIERENFERLADRVIDVEMGLLEEYSRFKIDGIQLADDWGTENQLMVNPEIWREIFKPMYKKQFDYIHKMGMHIFLHSCGYIWDIIPDLIEIGLDVLNVEQPLLFGTGGINGIDRLSEEFGGKICFLSNVDSQRTLINGTKEEIVEEVKHLIRALGKYKGGFIALADCGQDHGYVPQENIKIMSQAFKEYGRLR
ncbi:MAG: hypothetical protein HY606_05640 [Planctomycetes bacterium]|nr:hypothetical protein [Planctomycetota bacterium]